LKNASKSKWAFSADTVKGRLKPVAAKSEPFSTSLKLHFQTT